KENINPAGCAWQAQAPVSYTFSGTDGLKTLYGFARDAAGNISMPLVSQVVIDTTPPIIPLDPVVRFITDSTAQVQWQTNEPAHGTVVYGTSNPPTTSVSEPVNANTLAHGLTLTGLLPTTTYYLKVTASDALDNGPTESFIVSFTTKQAPDQTAPVITAGPAVVSIGSNTATVVWKTDEPSTGAVSGSFGATINDPAGLTVNHSVTLSTLSASTTYTVQVSAKDAINNGPTTSPVISFTTQAAINSDSTPPVIIQGPQALGITDSSANIVWATDEASDGSVSYSDGVSTLVARDPAFGNVHNIVLTGLKQATQYSFTVSSSDRVPNGPTTSLAKTFTTKTTPDVTPPAFMSGPNAVFIDTQRAFIIWDTDEQSDSLVEYGLAANSLDRAAASADLLTRHGIQLSNLEINTPYFYRVRSRDVAGNEAVSLTKSFTTKDVVRIVPLLLTQQPAIDFNTGTMARVTWKTNKPADTRVIFGEASGANLVELSLMDKTTNHVMILPNLLPGTTYTVLYSSTDMDNLTLSGYVVESGGSGAATVAKAAFSKATISRQANSNTGTTSFTTPQSADTAPPVITAGPAVTSTGDTTTTIQWTTNEIADSQVSCTQDGQSSPLTFGDVAQALSHSLVLTRLTPNTTYTCQVASTDPLGNGPTTSNSFSFTTATVADTTPPALTAAPTLTLKGNGLAALAWKTDKAASSVVRYGAPSALNDLLATNGATTDHSLTIANLTPGTLYNYTVELTDPSNNTATTSPLVMSLKYGDCDNTGAVNIAEVQSAINMFLGLKTPQICVDFDAAGSVSTSKVQKTINSFLAP
ncbi:MAG: fibronectin type III domain-containing protein, partial [Deltaproteobacteria bacterium]|nr:fibronectin type III domain-containing protein [Deltaproteobacteria bacterium]